MQYYEYLGTSRQILVRNHLNVVYVTNVLKDLNNVIRYLRKHNGKMPYQCVNCDMKQFNLFMIFKELSQILKFYISEISKNIYQRRKHISATFVGGKYFKWHSSILLFNEKPF